MGTDAVVTNQTKASSVGLKLVVGALLVIGILIHLIVIGTIRSNNKVGEYQFVSKHVHQTQTGGCSYSGEGHANPVNAGIIAVAALLGSSFVALAILLMLRRFSLRVLLITMFLVGASVTLLLTCNAPNRPKVLIEIAFDYPLSNEDVDLIRCELQPATVLEKLPDGFRRELGIPFESLRVSVQQSAPEPGWSIHPGMRCEVELPDDIPLDTEIAIREFFDCYALLLCIESMRAKGLTVKEPQQGWPPDWQKWRKEWDAKRGKTG